MRFSGYEGSWNKVALCEVANIIGGGTPDTSNPLYWNGDIDWFTPTEVGESKYVNESKRKITYAGFKGSSAKLLPRGSILLSTRASVGLASITTNPQEVTTNQGFQSVVPKRVEDSEFLYYVISNQNTQRELKKKANGSTFPEISNSEVSSIIVSLPPDPKERFEISRFLATIDQRIQLQNKIIRDLESQIVAINNRFFDSLQSVALFHDLYEYAGEGGTPDTKERDYYEPQEIPFIKIENLYEKYLRSHSAHISEIGLRNSSAWLVPAQCVLLSNGATIGECTITTYPVCTKQGILGIVPSSQTSAEFLYLLFKSRCFKRKLRCITTKGTMDAVYLKDMNQMIVPFCNQKEQQRHIGAMKPFEEKLEMEKRLLFCLKKEKEYLLRNLFI